MGIRDLKSFLSSKTEKELIEEISGLYRHFKNVRDFYDVQLSQDHAVDLLKQHKKILKDEFLPQRGFGDARLSVARKTVMDYKKIVGLNENLADLALYYVEIGVQYTNTYGDIDEPFYNSMETMFEQALKWMKQLNLLASFQSRAEKICAETENIGWGFHDMLGQIYSDYFD